DARLGRVKCARLDVNQSRERRHELQDPFDEILCGGEKIRTSVSASNSPFFHCPFFFQQVLIAREMPPSFVWKYEHRTSIIEHVQPKRRRRKSCLLELTVSLR